MQEAVRPPEVNTAECNGCGICVKECPVFVLAMKEKKAIVENGDWCIECGHCGAVCPKNAVIQQKAVIVPELKAGKEPAISPEVCMQLLRERRSVRIYQDKAIPRDEIDKIIDAGRYAPTGGNSQRVHYIVLTSPDEIAKLNKMIMDVNGKFFKNLQNKVFASMMSLVLGKNKVEEMQIYAPKILHSLKVIAQGGDPMFHSAPAILIVHAESWDGSPAFNCAAALYHCSLLAHTMGIGVCFNGWVENTVNINRKMKKWLGIPGDHKCFGCMTMGYQNVEYKRLIERKKPDVQWR